MPPDGQVKLGCEREGGSRACGLGQSMPFRLFQSGAGVCGRPYVSRGEFEDATLPTAAATTVDRSRTAMVGPCGSGPRSLFVVA